ncbi:BglG family transcription antiterminator [Bacillus sp. T33-2]|uniref:BglG family transcription antiterminator n=1 Tax=Bacillus sp. T33-2 TaxID=2054168 RepID=UPI000C76D517|nr:BglG family transcription antiterminator [Bacillus sp. T33-2]PLR91907.1 PTS sugar transporter [Bacillus sp. T33-2]
MALDQRSSAILSHLVQADSYVPVKELVDKFNISRRTIYYDVEKINGWLKDNKLPLVSHVRTAGFYLDKSAAEAIPEMLGKLKAWQYEYTTKERRAWLAIYVMAREAPLFLENLMGKTRVSRNTTIEDLKCLKDELTRFQLQLDFDRRDGYIVRGEEEEKRKAIVFYLQHVISDKHWQVSGPVIPVFLSNGGDENAQGVWEFEKLMAIEKILAESEKELNIQFTDEFVQSLAFRLMLFARRLSRGKRVTIDPVEKEVLNESTAYQVAQRIAGKLAILFDINFPKDETLYITKHLLSSRIQFSEHSSIDMDDAHRLDEVVSKMVTDFQRYACVVFQDRVEMEKILLMHVKPAFYRVKYGLEVENNATEMIQRKYNDIFLITRKVIHHLEEAAGKEVNDNETALIAAHFGGWMRKTGAKPAIRKRALVVCTKGVGTSRLLQQQLEGLFSTIDIIGSVSLREYEQFDYDADFIFSTIPLDGKDKPVYVVSPILTDAEKENLLKQVNISMGTTTEQRTSVEALISIMKKHGRINDLESLKKELKQYLYQPAPMVMAAHKPSLCDLLQPQKIQFIDEVADWQEAIRIAAQPLLKEGSVTEKYIHAMIESIQKMGPYVVIAPKVAIPHARPEDGVNKLGMSLLKLSHGIPFSKAGTHDVNLVVVLAAIDGEAHLKALSQLSKMLSCSENIEQLIKAETPQVMLDFVNAYSV